MNIRTHAVGTLALALFIGLAVELLSVVATADDGVGNFPTQAGPATVSTL